MNPLIDRLPVGNLPVPRKIKQVFELFEDVGYVDVWRKLHPSEKEYTFYSNPHKWHTCTDYFFLPKVILKQVFSCKIGQIDISVHAAVYLDFAPKC